MGSSCVFDVCCVLLLSKRYFVTENYSCLRPHSEKNHNRWTSWCILALKVLCLVVQLRWLSILVLTWMNSYWHCLYWFEILYLNMQWLCLSYSNLWSIILQCKVLRIVTLNWKVLDLVYKAIGFFYTDWEHIMLECRLTDIKSTLLGCTAIGIVYTDLGSIILVCRAIGMVCTVYSYNISKYN
jgi:hypothetical protein